MRALSSLLLLIGAVVVHALGQQHEMLVDTLQLEPELADLFARHGITDKATFLLLTDEALKDMGVLQMGTRLRILDRVAKLKPPPAAAGGVHHQRAQKATALIADIVAENNEFLLARFEAMIAGSIAGLREEMYQQLGSARGPPQDAQDDAPRPARRRAQADTCTSGTSEENENVQKASLWLRGPSSGDGGRVVFGATADVSLFRSGNGVLRTDSNFCLMGGGRIGLGEEAPQAPIHLTGASGGGAVTSNALLMQRTDAANPSARVQFVGSGGTSGKSWAVMTDSGATNNFGIDYKVDGAFTNNADDKLFSITTGGDVGVGTTSPAAKLDVQGNIVASGSITASGAVDPSSHWLALHMAAAAACRGSDATQGCCAHTVHVRNGDGKTCSQICADNSMQCATEVSLNGVYGRATEDGQQVGTYFNYECSSPGGGGGAVDLSCPAGQDCGGLWEETTYTAPDGTTVVSSAVNWDNSDYYYLKNVVDGSDTSSHLTTCTSPGGNDIKKYHCYWLSANGSGDKQDETITITFPSVRAIGAIDIRPKTRSGADNNYKIDMKATLGGAWISVAGEVDCALADYGDVFSHSVGTGVAGVRVVRVTLIPGSGNYNGIDEIMFTSGFSGGIETTSADGGLAGSYPGYFGFCCCVTAPPVVACGSLDAGFNAYESTHGDGICWLRKGEPTTALEACTGLCASAGLVDAPVSDWASTLSDNAAYRTALRDAHCPTYNPQQFATDGGNSATYCKISPYCQKWTTPNYWACHSSDAATYYDVDSAWTDGNPSARSCPCKGAS